MHVSETIRTKRAMREFADQTLPDQIVTAILDAGRRSQSGANLQPWHFIAIRNRDRLSALAQLGTYAGHLSGAALGVVIVTPPLDAGGWNMFDAGQVAAYMQLAAWELSVGSCIAAIFEPERARELLGIPPGLEAHIAISFGYPTAGASRPHSPTPGGRRPLEQVVHWDNW